MTFFYQIPLQCHDEALDAMDKTGHIVLDDDGIDAYPYGAPSGKIHYYGGVMIIATRAWSDALWVMHDKTKNVNLAPWQKPPTPAYSVMMYGYAVTLIPLGDRWQAMVMLGGERDEIFFSGFRELDETLRLTADAITKWRAK